MIVEYISANQFRVEEDRTGEFKTGRRIKAYCGVDGYVYSTILSSSYSDPYTTITIVENILTSNLEDVLYGIVNIGETGAFPDHLHDGTEGQGGALPYVTTTDFNTYSGILQTQINNKPDTFLELIDTPSYYDSGKYAISTSSGIVWATAGSSNVQTFLDLTDVPNTFSGTTGKFAQSTGSGVVWTTISAGSSNIQTFLDLTDTPNEYSEGLFAQSTASGIVWATASGSSAQTFIELIDTPSSYVGQEGKFVKVVGNVLEFATVSGHEGAYDSSWFFELDENGGLMPSTGSGILDIQSFLDLTDTPNTYSDGLYAKSTTSGIEWATVSGGAPSTQTFLDLTDTPNSYSNGKFAQSTEDGIVWTTVSGGGTGTSYGELELTYASDIVLDFTEYNLQSVILTGNTNFTFTNMTNGKPCVLNVIQDAQGSRSATFQSNIRWPQGVIPTTSSGSGLYDIFTFIQSRGTICGSCSAAFQLGS